MNAHVDLASYFAAKQARELPAVARRCEAEKWERCRANDEMQRAIEKARDLPAIREERNSHVQNCGMGS